MKLVIGREGVGGINRVRLREKNRKAIIDYFTKNPGATQAEAAEALGLTRQTLCSHVKSLRADGMVQERARRA